MRFFFFFVFILSSISTVYGTGGSMSADEFRNLQARTRGNHTAVDDVSAPEQLTGILESANKSSPGANPIPATGANIASLIQQITENASGVAPGSTNKRSLGGLAIDLQAAGSATQAVPDNNGSRLSVLDDTFRSIRNAANNDDSINIVAPRPTTPQVRAQLLELIARSEELRLGTKTFHDPGVPFNSLQQIIDAIF